jgi:hypothetical protein
MIMNGMFRNLGDPGSCPHMRLFEAQSEEERPRR